MRLLLAAALALLSACSSAPPIEPPQPLVEVEPRLTVRLLWQVDAGAVINRRRIPLEPIVDAESVTVGDLNGVVSQYDRLTGERLWRTDLGMRLTAAPGVGPEAIYLVGDAGRVAAVARDDGEVLWQATASSEVLTAPVQAGERLIVRSVDGRVQAWSAADASPQWTFIRDVPALSLRGNSRPLAVGGLLVIGLDDGRVVALDPANGEAVWERTLAQPSGRSEVERLVDIDGDPILYGDSIFIGAYQGRVARLDAEGRTLWSRPYSTTLRPAADGGLLFLVDDRSRVDALDLVTGAQRWQQAQLRGRHLTAPVSMGRSLVLGDLDGYVHWLDQEQGGMMARYRIDEYAIVAAPVALDDLVYVYTQGGVLAALQVTPAQP